MERNARAGTPYELTPDSRLSKAPAKSRRALSLGDVNFDNAVFNTFNMPPLHHIDYGAFVRAWKKEGTQRMGTLKGASSATGDDDGVDRSEVIRRHLSAGAGTPLYT